MATTYEMTVGAFTRSLQALAKYFDKAQAHADARKFEVDTLLSTRLAPDMLPFVRQVQMTCDTAKFTVARLLGKDAPKHEDNEKTVAELRQRVQKVLDYLATFKADEFNGCEDHRVQLPWAPGKWMHGSEYVTQLQIPNFYFHMAMCHALLRHNGVDVGKIDYLGAVNFQG